LGSEYRNPTRADNGQLPKFGVPNYRQFLRYMKCLADRFQLKIREGKTKRKKPPHF
jgi:hypothetical protein